MNELRAVRGSDFCSRLKSIVATVCSYVILTSTITHGVIIEQMRDWAKGKDLGSLQHLKYTCQLLASHLRQHP